MQTTTTPADRLTRALQNAGLTKPRAKRVTDLFPPAGQHWLAEQLDNDPHFTFTRLLATQIDQVADSLRTTTANTEVALKAFRTAVTA